VIGPGCSSGKHVTGYILSPVVAGGKYLSQDTDTSTGSKCSCLRSVAHSISFIDQLFFASHEPTLILRPGQKRCGVKRLSPKT
jgi:hypothetical protein